MKPVACSLMPRFAKRTALIATAALARDVELG